MRLTSALPVALAAALLGLHAADWWFYVADDTFISLRYADRLLAGEGLTWTAGPPVEGYSNLLWVLLTALIGLTGLPLTAAVRVLGLACGLGTVVAVAGPLARRSPAAGWVAGLGVAASTSVALWVPGGLEQPLVALLLAVALAVLGRGLRADAGPPTAATVLPAALALALLCWTRPDSPLLVAALALGWFLAAGQDRRALGTAAVLALVPAAATALQVAVRLVVYGDWVPNTAHVKVRPSAAHTDMGALWTAQALDAHLPLLALAALAFVFSPAGEPPRARLRLALPVLGAWLAWTVWIGGDIFPAFRHFVPMVVVLAWLAGTATAGLAARSRPLALGLAVLATGMLGAMTLDQRDHPVVVRATTEGWVVDGRDVGALLATAFADQQPLVALSPAGSIPYESRLPSLDMIGLNDAHLGRTESDGHGWIGHETGDGDYVFDQRPDLVFFTGPRGGTVPSFTSEKQLDARPDFRPTHALVHWQTTPRHAAAPVRLRPWLRRDGVLGPVARDGGLWVPGWLLTETGGPATLDEDGVLSVVLDTGDTASGTVALPPGTTAADWAPVARPGLAVTATPAPDPGLPGVPAQLTLSLRATAATTLRGLQLRRR